MAYSVRAGTKPSYRRKSFVIIAVMSLIAVIAVVLAIYNLIETKPLFVISYLIAAFLCVTYVAIRANTTYSTYIAADKRSVYMRRWTNGFMPYATGFPVALLREFIPARTELIEIPISEISAVYIGTKNFIKRTAKTADDFMDKLEPFERSKDFTVKRTVQTMDIFYAETFDGDYAYMPVTGFSKKTVLRLLKHINLRNQETEFFVYSRNFRGFTPVKVNKKEDVSSE
ncbi:MAG: hypothetical protein Q4G33_04180 [bacterium]|nr:hypothetical protein [bacterium]